MGGVARPQDTLCPISPSLLEWCEPNLRSALPSCSLWSTPALHFPESSSIHSPPPFSTLLWATMPATQEDTGAPQPLLEVESEAAARELAPRATHVTEEPRVRQAPRPIE